jgi:hypothetical protein
MMTGGGVLFKGNFESIVVEYDTATKQTIVDVITVLGVWLANKGIGLA